MKRWTFANRFFQWLIDIYLHPAPANRLTAWALLAGMVILIAEADYLVGIEVSLGIFYVIPITLATGWFGWRSGIGFVAASIVARVISDAMDAYPRRLPFHTWWNTSAAVIIYLFIVWLLDALLTLHRELEEKVDERTRQLKESVALREQLELEILEAGARERNAIGRELHDELGQHLTATALAAQALAQQLGGRPEAARAKSIVRWIEEGISKARKLARGLLLAHIEPDRLPQELRELALGASRGGVQGRFVGSGPDVAADGAQCAQLFRIAQEAVGNALRHARPQVIDITLATDEEALCLIVGDDGQGYERPGVAGGGFGLQIMEHRAKIIGASLSFVSSPGEGTKVICRLPKAAFTPQ